MMIFSKEHQHSKILCPSSYHISTQWKSTLMTNVTSCVSRCEDAEWETTGPCLIIAGHSQGGAIAKVASLDLSTITERYEVITFGEPDALRQNSDECSSFMNFGAHYRFNKGLLKKEGEGLKFDRVSYLGLDDYPGYLNLFAALHGVDASEINLDDFKTYPAGHLFIISSEDNENVAYTGLSNGKEFKPWDNFPGSFGDAHWMYKDDDDRYPGTGYFQILKKLYESSKDMAGIPINGFSNGMSCAKTEHASDLCQSGRCRESDNTCQPELVGNEEPCNENSECISGRCDGWNGNPFDRRCQDRKINGEGCDEDSDCISERCDEWDGSSFDRRCQDRLADGERCNGDNDCISGRCPSGFRRRCKALAGPDERCSFKAEATKELPKNTLHCWCI